MADVKDDLNQVITSAVNARVEAAVVEALSGGQLIGQYVAKALSQEVEVPKSPGGYGTVKVTFMHFALTEAFKGAAKVAIQKVVAEERDAIEEAARKELRRLAPEFAKSLTGQLMETVRSAYGINVTMRLPGQVG